jgi:hypothetical protein
MKKIKERFHYLQRVFSAYFMHKDSQLSFWHETCEVNEDAFVKKPGPYYMTFSKKADYKGPFDDAGIPLIDYKGNIGLQYNPIAIAQYGLAHYNIFEKNNSQKSLSIFIKQADWLVNNLESNEKGLRVWMHHFDWEYREVLKNPWYSALAQGQGISVLVRAYNLTQDIRYMEAADEAFQSLVTLIQDGGVQYHDKQGNVWLEEYIVAPPSHILNGFIWALWGVYDYWIMTQDSEARKLYDDCIETLKINLSRYDLGFWSLYELSDLVIKDIASSFYHSLHIVQLDIMYRLTKEAIFQDYMKKWIRYKRNTFYRTLAQIQKIFFKLLYY